MYQKAPPVMNMLALPKSPQSCPSDWETSKVLTKSQQNLKKIKYGEMGLPIYQIQMYQKVPPRVNYTDITQEIHKLELITKKY